MSPVGKLRLRRGLALAGSLLLLPAALCFLGWRYGFTPLPPAPIRPIPVSGGGDATNAANPSTELMALRRIAGTLTAEEAAQPFVSVVADNVIVCPSTWSETAERWSRSGNLSGDDRAMVTHWIAGHPEAGACEQALLEAPFGPALHTGEDSARAALARVLQCSLLEVALALERAEPDAAFAAFACAWRLRARWVSRPLLHSVVDERGMAQFEQELGRPFRRWVDQLPRLSRETAHAWMKELAALAESLPPVELGLAERRIRDRATATDDPPSGWPAVVEASKQYGAALAFDFRMTLQSVFGRLLEVSTSNGAAPRRGLALWFLLGALQEAVARDGDRQILTRAWDEAARRRLMAAEAPVSPPPPAGDWPDRDHWPWWRQALDRPAIWDHAPDFSSVDGQAFERRIWRTQLDVCRLAVALRCFQIERGHFPSRAEELVPDFLPTIPLDRFHGRPYGYEARPDGWTVWVVGPRDSGPLRFSNRGE